MSGVLLTLAAGCAPAALFVGVFAVTFRRRRARREVLEARSRVGQL